MLIPLLGVGVSWGPVVIAFRILTTLFYGVGVDRGPMVTAFPCPHNVTSSLWELIGVRWSLPFRILTT